MSRLEGVQEQTHREGRKQTNHRYQRQIVMSIAGTRQVGEHYLNRQQHNGQPDQQRAAAHGIPGQHLPQAN